MCIETDASVGGCLRDVTTCHFVPSDVVQLESQLTVSARSYRFVRSPINLLSPLCDIVGICL